MIFASAATRSPRSKAVDGGDDMDRLSLVGSTLNLTGKSILGFERIDLVTAGTTVRSDSLAIALLLNGRATDNDGVILENITLIQAEWEILLANGIDRITDASGVTTINGPPA